MRNVFAARESAKRAVATLFVGSDLLLHLGLVTGSPVLGLPGLMIGPTLWAPHRTTSRHLALLIATAIGIVLSRFPALVAAPEFRLSGDSAGLSPALPLGLSMIAAFVYQRTNVKGAAIVLSANIAFFLIALLASAWLSHTRADLITSGYALLAVRSAAESVNALALWRTGAPLTVGSPHGSRWLLGCACIAIGLTPTPRVPTHREISIWWPSTPVSEFRSVQGGGLGWQNIGHFGELPRVIQSLGYRVSRQSDLERLDAKALVLPVPFRELRTAEIAAIRERLYDGMAVLLIGEHTNLDRVQTTYNAILEGSGVALQFDTTNALFGDSSLLLKGPYLRNNPYLTHNRGASVRLSDLRSQGLLSGSWWHSDFGDPLAPEKGFLSDYHLSAGDRIGELTLAARGSIGDGEVFLWGDGTPFLNQNLAFNSGFIAELMRDLTGEPAYAWLPLLAAVVFLALGLLSRSPQVAVICAAVALLLPRAFTVEAPMPGSIAIISDRENNLFDRDPFGSRGITGLGVALTRAGLTPSLRSWEDVTTQPRAIFIINPQRHVTAADVDRLRGVASSGSTVVISGGGDNRSFQQFASAFGARAVGPPLGSLRGDELTTYSAWRLEAFEGTPIVAGGAPVGAAIQVGQGRVVILADEGFFYSKNLETESTFDERNLGFVRSLVGGE